MIRTTKHILKYQTMYKSYWIRELFEIHKAELNCYVEALFLNELPIRKFLSTKDTPGVNINHSNWKKSIYKQASEIICGNGINNEVKPVLKNFTIELHKKLFDIEWKKQGEFDGFIRIRLPFIRDGYKNQGIPICLPFKHHKNSLKYKNWKLLKTVNLKVVNGNTYLYLLWEKDEKRLKKTGKTIGFDSGYNNLLSDSTGKFHGSELKSIYEKLARQEQGSKNHKQTLYFRDSKINEVINKLPIKTYKQVIVEDLKNVKYKSKFSKAINNKMQYWSYSKSINKLERLCEEHGVQFTKVNPAYTSQSCPKCRTVDRKNRLGEKFLCTSCGYENHADTVGAINILNRGAYGLSTT